MESNKIASEDIFTKQEIEDDYKEGDQKSFAQINGQLMRNVDESTQESDYLIPEVDVLVKTEISDPDEYVPEENIENFEDEYDPRKKAPFHKSTKVNKCEYCNETFFGKQKFDRHLRIVHEVRSMCPECNKPVKDVGGHIKRRHAPKTEPCPICPNKLFSTVWERNVHVKSVHETPPKEKTLCTICNKGFADIITHTENIHTVKTFPCMLCDFTANLRMDVVRHTNEVHEKLAVQCPKCDKEVFNLEKHLSRHDRERFMCITCGEKFGLKDEVIEHYKAVHGSELTKSDPLASDALKGSQFVAPFNSSKVYINLRDKSNWQITYCKYCEYKSTTKSNVEKHEKTVHENFREKCDVCGKMVKNVQHHRRYVHEKKGLGYKCKICGFHCIRENALRAHTLAKHSELGKIDKKPCPLCGKHIKDVDAHIELIHASAPREKNLACDQCDYKTSTKSSLTMHVKSVHIKEITSCNICGKMVTAVAMRNHLKCHSQRRFSCVPCGKTFREKRDIGKHILYIHKQWRNVCPICQKADVTDLRLHVKTMHGINDFVDTTKDKDMVTDICKELNGSFQYNDGKSGTICTTSTLPSQSSERKFSCVPCRKTFLKKSKLARHILYIHRHVRNLCPFCNKDDVRDMKLHVKTTHSISDFLDTTADKYMIKEICAQLRGRFKYYDDADLINMDSKLHDHFSSAENVKLECIEDDSVNSFNSDCNVFATDIVVDNIEPIEVPFPESEHDQNQGDIEEDQKQVEKIENTNGYSSGGINRKHVFSYQETQNEDEHSSEDMNEKHAFSYQGMQNDDEHHPSGGMNGKHAFSYQETQHEDESEDTNEIHASSYQEMQNEDEHASEDVSGTHGFSYQEMQNEDEHPSEDMNRKHAFSYQEMQNEDESEDINRTHAFSYQEIQNEDDHSSEDMNGKHAFSYHETQNEDESEDMNGTHTFSYQDEHFSGLTVPITAMEPT